MVAGLHRQSVSAESPRQGEQKQPSPGAASETWWSERFHFLGRPQDVVDEVCPAGQIIAAFVLGGMSGGDKRAQQSTKGGDERIV